jgi:hypothetical protein
MISWLPHWKQFHEDGLSVFVEICVRRQGQAQDYDVQNLWVSGLVFTEYDIDGLPAVSHRLFIDIDKNSAKMIVYEWQFDILTDVKKVHCGFTCNSITEIRDITTAETTGISYEVITM